MIAGATKQEDQPSRSEAIRRLGDRAEGKEMKPSDSQQLRELAEQLRLLIECADRLPPSPERDAALGEISKYRVRLNAITARKTEH